MYLVKILAVALLLLAAQPALPEEAPEISSLDQLKFLTDQTQQKTTLCQITAVNGQTFAGYYHYYRTDRVFPKKDIEDLVELHDTAKDSLRYRLFSMGIDQAYAGIAGDKVEAQMFDLCMQHSLDEVANMDESASERADMERHQSAWENANCDEKMAQLYEAEYQVSEGKPLNEDLIAVVEDSTIRAAMRQAAAQSEALFSAYILQFNQECGLTDTEISKLRQTEPDAQCLHTADQLESVYDGYLDNGNRKMAEKQLARWIPDQAVRSQLAASLHSEDTFWDKVNSYIDNRCQSF